MKNQSINFDRREEYIECNLNEKFLRVIVEELEEPNSQIRDYNLTLFHHVENDKVIFTGSYKDHQFTIPLVGRDHEPGEYILPEELIGYTGDRIREAINWYVDRF